MFNHNKPLQFDKDSPITQACQEPQLMFVRHIGYSTHLKNKQRNKQLHEDWIKEKEVRGLQT